MRSGIEIRSDYTGDDLRHVARRSDEADQTRRLLALAVILDGGSRGKAARTGGVGLQVIRDWVLRFNADGPEALKTRKAPGKQPILADDQRAAQYAREQQRKMLRRLGVAGRWVRDVSHRRAGDPAARAPRRR